MEITLITMAAFLFILSILLLHTDFPNPVCAWLTFYYTFKSFLKTGKFFPPIDGCDYADDESPTPSNVQVLKCKRCGKYDIGWTWGKIDKDEDL